MSEVVVMIASDDRKRHGQREQDGEFRDDEKAAADADEAGHGADEQSGGQIAPKP